MLNLIPIDLKLGLFLFSNGPEIVEFAADQIEESTKFAIERYEEGKAFIEKMIAEYEGGAVGLLQCDEAVTDAFDRATEITSHLDGTADEFLQAIATAIAEDADAVRASLEKYKPSNVGVCGIPDDFIRGMSVASSQVAYHVPTGEDRVRFDEVTGAGEGVIYAIFDSGATLDHPDLIGKNLGAYSEVPYEQDPSDFNFHGTHVTSSFCGHPDLALAHKAKYISYKVFDRSGRGQSNWLPSAMRKARLWRGPNGERISGGNYSGGGGGPDAATIAEMAKWDEEGLLFFAAAGNDGWRQGQDTVNSPGRDINAFGVGSTDARENRSGFSSGGPLIDGADTGSNVVGANFRGGRTESNGTSMASPCAASKGACVESTLVHNGHARIHGTQNYREFYAANARDILAPGHDDGSGHGLLDVFEKMLEKKKESDGINLLADRRKPPSGGITSAILIFLLMLCGSSTMAQDAIEVKTVTTTIESVETFRDGVSLGAPKTRVVGEPRETIESMPAITFGEETRAVRLGPDLKPIEINAISPGRFVVEPGEFAVFPYPFPEGVMRFSVSPPAPEFDLSSIAPMARSLADNIKHTGNGKIGDPETRTRLAKAYESALDAITEGTDFSTAGRIVNATTDPVWPGRSFGSAGFEWVAGFQKPLQTELERIGINDTEVYRLAIKEVIRGLQADSAVKSFSEAYTWQPPAGQHYEGQRHDGRVCVKKCYGDHCRLVWMQE